MAFWCIFHEKIYFVPITNIVLEICVNDAYRSWQQEATNSKKKRKVYSQQIGYLDRPSEYTTVSQTSSVVDFLFREKCTIFPFTAWTLLMFIYAYFTTSDVVNEQLILK